VVNKNEQITLNYIELFEMLAILFTLFYISFFSVHQPCVAGEYLLVVYCGFSDELGHFVGDYRYRCQGEETLDACDAVLAGMRSKVRIATLATFSYRTIWTSLTSHN
jgi:hypothetical protein